MDGTVKAVKTDKGYGFISAHGSKDVFFHANGVERLLFDDQLVEMRVTFEVEQTNKGPRARHVQPAQD